MDKTEKSFNDDPQTPHAGCMKNKICVACKGTGKTNAWFVFDDKCRLCNGSGKIEDWDNPWPIKKQLK